MTDVVLYGGKGGVGKTTCAAATALAAAERGDATLAISTDPAHSLSDAFETDIGAGPTTIEPRLDAVQTDPREGLEEYRALFERLADDLGSVGISLADDDLRELFVSGLLPGSDELAALDQLAGIADSDYDRVVVDTAPTGHTLRLLDLPAAVGRGVETARSIGEQVRRKADAARTMFFGPYAARDRDDEDPFEEVLEDLQTVRSLLRDADRTEFRVVCLPERMVLSETERLIAQLREAEVPVDTLTINRVIEDEPDDCARCLARWGTQQTLLAEFADTFPDLDRVVLPDLTGEAEGRAALDVLAARLGP